MSYLIKRKFEVFAHTSSSTIDFELFFEKFKTCRTLCYTYHDGHYHAYLDLAQPINSSILESEICKCSLDANCNDAMKIRVLSVPPMSCFEMFLNYIVVHSDEDINLLSRNENVKTSRKKGIKVKLYKA